MKRLPGMSRAPVGVGVTYVMLRNPTVVEVLVLTVVVCVMWLVDRVLPSESADLLTLWRAIVGRPRPSSGARLLEGTGSAENGLGEVGV